MIETRNLAYQYPGGAKVMEGFSLRLDDGRIYGLLGQNGVGKTTLLGLFGGLLRPTAGSVAIDGVESRRRDPDILANLFYVQDEFALPGVSLSTYVKVNSPFYPRFDKAVLARCLDEFGMATGCRRLDQLSLGQRKKVMLSLAIASGAKTILMDEPSNGLDIPSKAQFRKVLASAMTDERLIVISTHQVHDVAQLIDSVVVMDNHGILLNASMGEISERYHFGTLAPGETVPDVIYSEPSIGGLCVMARRQAGQEESQVNLEMLFSAVTRGLVG